MLWYYHSRYSVKVYHTDKVGLLEVFSLVLHDLTLFYFIPYITQSSYILSMAVVNERSTGL